MHPQPLKDGACLIFIDIPRAGKHLLQDARPSLEMRILIQHRDAQVPAVSDRTRVRLLFAGDDAQQRALAGPIYPDQRDAVLLFDGKADIFHDLPDILHLVQMLCTD